MKILDRAPTIFSQRKPGCITILREQFDKMKEGQVLVIPKKEWIIKTPPVSIWQSYRLYKNFEYSFSGRQDKDNWYLMKVKFPISVEGEALKRVWEIKHA